MTCCFQKVILYVDIGGLQMTEKITKPPNDKEIQIAKHISIKDTASCQSYLKYTNKRYESFV